MFSVVCTNFCGLKFKYFSLLTASLTPFYMQRQDISIWLKKSHFRTATVTLQAALSWQYCKSPVLCCTVDLTELGWQPWPWMGFGGGWMWGSPRCNKILGALEVNTYLSSCLWPFRRTSTPLSFRLGSHFLGTQDLPKFLDEKNYWGNS